MKHIRIVEVTAARHHARRSQRTYRVLARALLRFTFVALQATVVGCGALLAAVLTESR
jgi:uncharacterized membrane protein